MSRQRYSPEFKEEAARQTTQRGYSVREVAELLGVSTHSLYKWVREVRPDKVEVDELATTKLENQKLKVELRRVQEERDILKMAAVGSTGLRNTLLKYFCWCKIIQCFSRPLIES